MRYRQLKGVSDLFTHYFLCFVVGVWGVLRDVDRKEGKEMIKQAALRTRKGNQYRFILNSFYSSLIFFLMDFIKGFPFLLRHKNFLCPSFVHKEFICSLPGLCDEEVSLGTKCLLQRMVVVHDDHERRDLKTKKKINFLQLKIFLESSLFLIVRYILHVSLLFCCVCCLKY